MSQRTRRRGGNSRSVGIVAVAAFLLLIFVALVSGLFSVQSIEVQGNRFCTKEEVIASSGIMLGQNILTIKTDQVKAGINSNRYLEFVGLWRNFFPSSVILTVSEHSPRAKMMWMGMLIVVGDNGVVLERTSTIDMHLPVPEIIGMKVQSDLVGEPIDYSVPGQEEAINRILDALDMQGVTAAVTEINIASPDNLTLLTEYGIQVILGDDDRLDEKIALMRDALPKVQSYGAGGILNVSSGQNADYQRPSR